MAQTFVGLGGSELRYQTYVKVWSLTVDLAGMSAFVDGGVTDVTMVEVAELECCEARVQIASMPSP